MVEQIKILVPNFNPKTVTCDFEMAIINTFQFYFSEAEMTLCYYHFKQNLWRQIQGFSWQKRYMAETTQEEEEEEEDSFALKCKMVAALAFLPVDDVVRGFELLLQAHRETKDLLYFIEENYIGTVKNR